MKRFIQYLVISGVLVFGGFMRNAAKLVGDEYDWPQRRGPLVTGYAPESDTSVESSKSKNVRWKAALPGKGHSIPIVPGDRIFPTTAIPYGELLPPTYCTAPGTHDSEPVTQRHEFVVLAISRRDGTILWQKSVHRKLPYEGGHYTASLASNSAVTDGMHVFACFGSHGLYCLDLQGEVIWQKTFGEMRTRHRHGESSSSVVYGDNVFINWDHDGPCFVAASVAAFRAAMINGPEAAPFVSVWKLRHTLGDGREIRSYRFFFHLNGDSGLSS